MENKGVAPILATVLIVLVVIALASTFLIWSTRTLGTTTERGTEQTQQITGATEEGIQILAISCPTNAITISNSGGTTYGTANVNVFENDVLRTVTWGRATLQPGNITNTTSLGGFTLDSDDTIRVVAPQGASDSDRCP